MTQTYRTNDPARWGTGQGFNLSPAQVDINFWDLIQRMIAQESRPDPAAGIDYFSISGTMMYVHMTDGTVLGPYELPIATFRDRGEWAPSTIYAVMDTFTVNGGLYVVIFAHTSKPTFDAGANDGAGHDYYQLMLQTPGSTLPTGGAVGMVVEKATTVDYQVMWGFKLPPSGSTRQYLIKQSGTNQDAIWDDPLADDIKYTPSFDSVLTSNNVQGALDEIEARSITSAADVPYTPSLASTLTSDNVQDALNELGAGIDVVIGRQTIWVPASAMTPFITNGPAANLIEMTTNKNLVRTLDFDSSTQEYAQFDIVMPKSWDLGGIFFKVFWSHPSATTNFNVAFIMDAASVSDSDNLDGSFISPVTVVDTGGLTDTLYVSAESAAIASSWVFGDLIMFRISRNPAHPSDTLATDARLHGVQIFYTTTAATDN